MTDKQQSAFSLLGWETALTAEIPDHIVFSVIFATSEENRNAGKMSRVQLVVSRKKALELSRDLVQAANTELPKSPKNRH